MVKLRDFVDKARNEPLFDVDDFSFLEENGLKREKVHNFQVFI